MSLSPATRGLVANSALGLLGSVCMAVAMAIAVRRMDVAEWGHAAALVGVAQVLGGLLSFGTPVERVRRYARLSPDEARRAALTDTTERVALGALLACVSAALAMVDPTLGAVCFAASGVFVSLGAPNYFAGVRRYLATGALVLHEKVLVLALVAMVSFAYLSAAAFLVILGSAGWATAVLGVLLTRGRGRSTSPRVRPSARGLARGYVRARHLGIASIAPTLLLLDASLVNVAAGAEQAGYFGIGVRVVGPATVVISSLVIVLLPHFSAEANLYRIPPVGRRAWTAAVACVIGLAGLGLWAEWWVPAIFGVEYSASVTTVRLYLVNVVMVLFTRTFATVLQAWDDDKMVSLCISLQVLAALVGIYVGATLGGATAASFSLAATNGVLALVLARRVATLVRRGRR